MDRGRSHARLGRDVAHGGLHARPDEDSGGRVEQGLLVAPGIRALGPGSGLPGPRLVVLHRSVPPSRSGPGHQRRGDAVRAHRPAARGKDQVFRLLGLPRVPDRGGAVGRPRAPAEPLRHRAAQLLRPPARSREPRAAPGRAVRTRGAGVEPAGLGTAVRRGAGGPGGRHAPVGDTPRALRPRPARQPGPARRRREARRDRRGGGADRDPARARLRHRARTRPSPPRSSGPARRTSCSPGSPPPAPCFPRTSSTRSAPWSRPVRTSPRTRSPTPHPRCPTRRCGAAGRRAERRRHSSGRGRRTRPRPARTSADCVGGGTAGAGRRGRRATAGDRGPGTGVRSSRCRSRSGTARRWPGHARRPR